MIHARGVELNELHVGYAGTGPVCQRDSIAGRNIGIAGIQVGFTGTAGAAPRGDRRHRGRR